MRYFYRIGEFTRSSQKRINLFSEGQVIHSSIAYVVDKKYDHCGWDVRSWESTNIFKEVTEKDYHEILKSEEEIKKQKREIGLEKIGHHFPVIFSDEEIVKLKNAGFNFDEFEKKLEWIENKCCTKCKSENIKWHLSSTKECKDCGNIFRAEELK